MDKKFFMALMLSALTVWGLQYYFNSKTASSSAPGVASASTQPVAGQALKAPTTQELYRPLNLDVKFKEELVEKEDIQEVTTKLYKASFSNRGGVLLSIEFLNYLGKDKKPLKSDYDCFVSSEKSSAPGSFILALEDETPYSYNFLYKQDRHVDESAQATAGDFVEIAYQAETAFWTVTKIYNLDQNGYRFDLTLKFEPKVSDTAEIRPIRARLLFSAPEVDEMQGNQLSSFVYNESKNHLDKVEQANTKDLFWFWSTSKAMFGIEDKYFVSSLIADSSKFAQRGYFRTSVDGKSLCSVIEGPELKSAQSFTTSFYMGPKVLENLNAADQRLVELLSFGWLSWLCQLLLKLLAFLVFYLKNYGWAIVVLTILLRIPFIPLSVYGRNKMEAYQRYQPTIQKIRQKYRQDLVMQNQELMKFHKDHNLSTATPLLGCLPLLIQMPILFALYKVLGSYLALYQAPFVGWIVDLSAKDPYYILPGLMGLTMLWQQIITPSSDEKQKVMMYFVSIIITALFANFPAGLVLYWTMNNVMTIAEDYFRRYVLR